MDNPAFLALFRRHGAAGDEAHFPHQFAGRRDPRDWVLRLHLQLGVVARTIERQEHDSSLGRAVLRLHDRRVLAVHSDVSGRAKGPAGG